MCGIVGIINYRKTWQGKMRECIQQLLIADVLRGKDSTGVFKAKGKETDWRKAACPPWEFFGLKNMDEFFWGLGDTPFVVGHNRWATKGKVINANAHPFEEGKITLVHNGTVWGYRHQLVDGTKFEVDSQAIAHSINKVGIDETIRALDGAYALAYYNAKNQTLNLIRNKERPLFVLEFPKDDMLWFGSEVDLLKWVGKRNGFIPGEFKLLEEHLLHTFEAGNPKPIIRKLTPKSVVWQGGQHRGYLPLERLADDDYGYEGGYCGTGAAPGNDPAPVEPPVASAPTRIDTDTGLGGVKGDPLNPRPLPQQRPAVFHQHRRHTPNNPQAIHRFSVKELIRFSLKDWGDGKFQGNFVPVVGEIITDKGEADPDFIVMGNFPGAEQDVQMCKKIMCGVATSVRARRDGKIQIDVKDVFITDDLDPLAMSIKERADWIMEKGKQLVAKATAGAYSAKLCGGCKKLKPATEMFLVYKTGGPRDMCKECLHSYDSKGVLGVSGNVVPLARPH